MHECILKAGCNINVIQNAAKLGLAVAIEAADEAVMEQQEQAGPTASAGAIPF
jgi:mitochondrial import receptor subunit TOM40